MTRMNELMSVAESLDPLLSPDPAVNPLLAPMGTSQSFFLEAMDVCPVQTQAERPTLMIL